LIKMVRKEHSLQNYIPVRFDITDQIPSLTGKLEIAGWLFVPCSLANEKPHALLFCLPGGSYTKAYYHLLVEGYPAEAYSFAHFMAERGFLVLAIDHLGVGESTRPDNDLAITMEVIAAANALVVEKVRHQLAEGSLAANVPPLPSLPVLGIGHSMGAQALIEQQSRVCDLDGLGLLGWSNQGINLGGTVENVADVAAIEEHEVSSTEGVLKQVIQNEQMNEMLAALRVSIRPFFYAADVPIEVIQADEKLAVPIPMGVALAPNDPQTLQLKTASIRVPIFLGNGTLDVAANFRAEPATYPHSSDITLFELAGSGHCHNFAPTRALLWDRLAWWINTLVACHPYSLSAHA
jgi:pimeloyl-ACP methyl ester carboxylesterase